MRSLFLGIGLCLLLTEGAVAQTLIPEPSLWCSDDIGRRIFRVSMDGSFVHSSFHSGSVSGISIDPTDGTIWATKEGWAKLIRFDRLGNELTVITTSIYDPSWTGPEGVAVDFFDDTLWLIDDDAAMIYNLAKDGTLLTSFSTTLIHPNATSPQAIAADPTDGTLWVTENRTDAIYNITVTGDLLGTFKTASFSPAATNIQGVNVDEADGTLLVTDRPSHTVYRLERDGTLISTFDTAHFGSLNPSGVVFDSFALPYVPDLDRTGLYSVLGSRRIKFRGTPEVQGHVALAPGAKQAFEKGTIDGILFVDPTADNTHKNEVVITEGTITSDLTLEAAEMMDAADAYEALPATQTFDRIDETTTIEGGAGLNVIDVTAVVLRGDETLTLTGGNHARFVLNVKRTFRMRGNASLLVTGDVDPRNVVINVHGRGGVRLAGDSTASGIFMATGGSGVKLAQRAELTGCILTTGNIGVFRGADVVHFDRVDL